MMDFQSSEYRKSGGIRDSGVTTVMSFRFHFEKLTSTTDTHLHGLIILICINIHILHFIALIKCGMTNCSTRHHCD